MVSGRCSGAAVAAKKSTAAAATETIDVLFLEVHGGIIARSRAVRYA
jgi:hypothetical protein